jgi:hypothetical protein
MLEKSNGWPYQMSGVMQTLGTDTIQVMLKTKEIAGEGSNHLNEFLLCLSAICFLGRLIESKREMLGLEWLIAEDRSERNQIRATTTHRQSVIALNVMRTRVGTRKITKCAVLEFEMGARIRERAETHFGVSIKDRRALDVMCV